MAAAGGRALHKVQPESQTDTLPLEERIRQRAHQIYLQRGGQDGSDMEDWLQAEEEIRRTQEGME